MSKRARGGGQVGDGDAKPFRTTPDGTVETHSTDAFVSPFFLASSSCCAAVLFLAAIELPTGDMRLVCAVEPTGVATADTNEASKVTRIMAKAHYYGTTAKLLHWTIVVLLVAQYAVGWLMPDVHRGPPGTPMILHMSLGVLVLTLIVVRLAWRLTHPIAPDTSLPRWQHLGSEAVHWLLYTMVIATTVIGWLFASFRGWSVRFFGLFHLPMLSAQSPAGIKAIDGWHQAALWILLGFIGLHVAALSLIHI